MMMMMMIIIIIIIMSIIPSGTQVVYEFLPFSPSLAICLHSLQLLFPASLNVLLCQLLLGLPLFLEPCVFHTTAVLQGTFKYLTENNNKCLDLVRLVAMKILTQIAQDTSTTGLSLKMS
jgi:hypothetical protein